MYIKVIFQEYYCKFIFTGNISWDLYLKTVNDNTTFYIKDHRFIARRIATDNKKYF